MLSETKTIEINKKKYNVLCNEFVRLCTELKYCNLIILEDLAFFERLASLINEISKCYIEQDDEQCQYEKQDIQLFFKNPTHGGFIPLECSPYYKNVIIDYEYNSGYDYENTKNDIQLHKNNIEVNMKTHNISNIIINSINGEEELQKTQHYNEKYVMVIISKSNVYTATNPINISKYPNYENNVFIVVGDVLRQDEQEQEQEYKYHKKFILKNTEHPVIIYVPNNRMREFTREFYYFFEENPTQPHQQNFLNYDNLLNLCVIVKNGGTEFAEMLKRNFEYFDRWTIMDTGSTDDTIQFIKDILVGKKKGKLYEEPFTDFGETRNRCLDRAGNCCKFNVMLDDTYVIEGNYRKFSEFVRADQFADSYSFYVKSDDVEYISNRMIKSDRGLKYLFKIHEVITPENNKNVVIPKDDANILDLRTNRMHERTMTRKRMDLEMLFEEVERDPYNPRHLYYVAQTYNILDEPENAFLYFLRCYHHPNPDGFVQEKLDAIFEAARIANFKLNKPWEECEKYYNWAYELDKTRPDSLYFIGIHYFLENTKSSRKIAFDYFKQALYLGYPIHSQYSLKPTLSFYFVPKFVVPLAYEYEDYQTGKFGCETYLKNNTQDSDLYYTMVQWYGIFDKLMLLPTQKSIGDVIMTTQKVLCFVADGGWGKWSGRDILTKGVGGSETYIIEMARYIQKRGNFQVVVFCNCECMDIFEGVIYLPLLQYYPFIIKNFVHTSIISRYLEYLPPTYKSNVENVYLVLHDLSIPDQLLIDNPKLKGVFCLTEWHCEEFLSKFSNKIENLNTRTTHLYYGIDTTKFDINTVENENENNNNDKGITITQKNISNCEKIPHKFIYSSFPNRGLYYLLKMWPIIYEKYPSASLYIYSDVDGEWVNRVVPEMMENIRNLLKKYREMYPDTGMNIHYFGWVDKTTLANSWKSADIWFYPCIFEETFCLTALEAAATKTLVITSNLAALKYTVADRGILIDGKPDTDKNWEENALEILFTMMDEKNINYKQHFLEKNYKWAMEMTWNNQSLILENIISKNKTEYRGIYDTLQQDEINDVLSDKKLYVKSLLELGTYTGTSTIELLGFFHNACAVCVDKWEKIDNLISCGDNDKTNSEQNDTQDTDADILRIEQSFYNNINNFQLTNRVLGRKMDYMKSLTFSIKNNEVFDFIYIRMNYLKKTGDFNMGLLCLSYEVLNKKEDIGTILLDNDLEITPSKNQELKIIKEFSKKYGFNMKYTTNQKYILLTLPKNKSI